MTRLSELIRDKSSSKKRDREEKTKTPASKPPKQTHATPTPPEAEKPEAPKEKGVVFREPVPPSQPKPLLPSRDKGKSKMVETPPPKKHRITPEPDPKHMVLHT